MEIAHAHAYSKTANAFNISPLLQDHLLVLTQELPYSKAHELAQRLLASPVSRSTMYRLTMHYGEAIASDMEQPPEPPELLVSSPEVVYAMADGLMLLFDEGYKETKLGRIFPAQALTQSPVANRGGQIACSDYVAHAGSWAGFWAVWSVHIAALVKAGHEVVFISDGVLWLHEQLKESYPNAVMILDIYHVMEHLGEVAKVGIEAISKRKRWLDDAYNLLTESRLSELLLRIEHLSIPADLQGRIKQYLLSNQGRLDYKAYLNRGLTIGSGAIESANKSVVQARLKRSGQRWTRTGAQRLLNLRTCWMSGRWGLVGRHIEPPNGALVA